jgi:membrane protein DedA with SNARE-associated domain
VIPIRFLLLRHGYSFLFFYVFAVAAGMPVPADPLLIIMGALVGDHQYSLWNSLFIATAGSLAGDLIWYELGRRRGRSVLALLCKLSLEPDTCVRKTETRFARSGVSALLFVKFLPGVSLISMPLAGATRMPFWSFLLADAAGCLVWCTTYLGLGVLFHRQLTTLLESLGLLGQRAGMVAAALVSAYVAFKYFQRVRFRRELRINRVTPKEALDLLQSGQPVTFVDLRNPKEIELDGYKIANARILSPEDLRAGSHEIPEGLEAILYCT